MFMQCVIRNVQDDYEVLQFNLTTVCCNCYNVILWNHKYHIEKQKVVLEERQLFGLVVNAEMI
jgi:hypothetical protein